MSHVDQVGEEFIERQCWEIQYYLNHPSQVKQF